MSDLRKDLHFIYCEQDYKFPGKNRYYYLGIWRNPEKMYGLKIDNARARKKYLELKKAGKI